jgi:hypothetical protein
VIILVNGFVIFVLGTSIVVDNGATLGFRVQFISSECLHPGITSLCYGNEVEFCLVEKPNFASFL